MSIWGRRVDAAFSRSATRDDYNKAGLNAIWQIALVILVAVLANYLATHIR